MKNTILFIVTSAFVIRKHLMAFNISEEGKFINKNHRTIRVLLEVS